MQHPIKETIRHGSEQMNVAVYDHTVPGISARFYPHWHAEYEFIYVYYGNVPFELDGTRYAVGPGQGLLINRRAIHSCAASRQQRARYVCLVFGERFLFPDPADPLYDEYIRNLQGHRKAPPAFLSGAAAWEKRILADIRDAIENYFQRSAAAELNLRIRLLDVFYTLFRADALVPIDGKTGRQAEKIRRVLLWMEQNCTQPIKMGDLAARLHICPAYFCRLFRAAVGQSPKEYLIHCRIAAAASALTAGDESVAAIAARSGFADFNYFSRCFKKVVGISPTEYRGRFADRPE